MGKGVPGTTLKKQTTMEHYLKMLTAPFDDNPASSAEFHTLRSFRHQVFLMHMEKRMLGVFNDKVFDRYPEPNRPLGHPLNRAETFEARIARLTLRRSFHKLRAVQAC